MCALCSIQGRQSLRSPLNQSRDVQQKCSDFFFQQLPNPWFVIFHMGCTAHTVQPGFLSPLYPCSLARLFVFWSPFSLFSLSHFHFPFPQIASHLSEYFAFRFLSLSQPQSSLFTVTAHIVTLFSAFIPTFFPGQPGTGALGSLSIFQR